MIKRIYQKLTENGYEVEEREVKNAYKRESRTGGIFVHSEYNITRYLILNKIAKKAGE